MPDNHPHDPATFGCRSWWSEPQQTLGGVYKSRSADFIVQEVPLYPHTASGDHYFVEVQKTGISHEQMLRLLAQTLAIPVNTIGYAGRKDTHAMTRQWLSLPELPVPRLPEIGQNILGGDATGKVGNGQQSLTILAVTRHNHKLRLGHLAGNRFTIMIRQVRHDQQALARITERICQRGVLNFFGPQRFGAKGDNHLLGLRIITKEAIPRSCRSQQRQKLFLSAWQSWVFNHYLAARFRFDPDCHVMAGDVLQTKRGGSFLCIDTSADAPRLAAGDICLTGPLPGTKSLAAQGTAGTWEDQAIAAAGIQASAQLAHLGKKMPGSRRALFCEVVDLEAAFLAPDGDATEAPVSQGTKTNLKLSFFLPAGSFATNVIAEYMGILKN